MIASVIMVFVWALKISSLEATSSVVLQFTASNQFKIVQFTDLHLGEKDDYDVSTAKLMYQVITNQNPQLSVITGDVVSGSFFNSSEENWFKNKWAKM
jgi:predicted MPP superfamily phosphohydrolase